MNTNRRKLVAALSLCTAVIPNLAAAAFIPDSNFYDDWGDWRTTLQARDLNGDLTTVEAYYDTAQNVTWLAEVNYALTSGYDSDGRMNWYEANEWAASLNPYGSGITGWRLPSVNDINREYPGVPDGCTFYDGSVYWGVDCGYNIEPESGELAYMYYTTLGNSARYEWWHDGSYLPDAQPGGGLYQAGPFSFSALYREFWSATEYAPDPSLAWDFYFGAGEQGFDDKDVSKYVWAVHAGDVGVEVVPVPAAVWLFGSGLLGLVGLGRKRRR